jgi:UDP-glucose 4-epimerase
VIGCRYLVTGGAGFIGSHLVDALVAHNPSSEIRVLDNLHRGRLELLDEHSGDNVSFHEGDIRDRNMLKRIVQGVDVVFHLAAQSNVIGAGQDIQYSASSNVMGTINVLQASLEAGVKRVVFSSSREVYGDPRELPVLETAPFAAKNLYGASKVAGEMYCRAFATSGLDVCIVRLGNVYGTRDSGRVIPIWLERAQAGLDLEIYGGKQIIDFVPVQLVTEAMIRVAEIGSIPGPINIASGKGTRITDLATRIIELTGSNSRALLAPARSEEVVGFVADVTGMREHLGLEPPCDPLVELEPMILGRLPAAAHAI